MCHMLQLYILHYNIIIKTRIIIDIYIYIPQTKLILILHNLHIRVLSAVIIPPQPICWVYMAGYTWLVITNTIVSGFKPNIHHTS